LLVLAQSQTAGRGQKDRRWWSDAGSLTFTLVIDPASFGLQTNHEPRAALAAAVAIVEATADLLPPGAGGIRWPNDVEVGGRKLAGVLPERIETIEGPRLLIGIGLNVTTDLSRAPCEVKRLATSLALECRPGLALPEAEILLGRLLAWLEATLGDLARDEPALVSRWADLDTLRGRSIHVDMDGEILQGIALGINPEGALFVADCDGRGTRTIFAGSVLRK
jgi:BirA family transcriptional regulator, biotin operon repressor / biotin---[acetyl-CoA-carboxylase] ligase